MLLLCVGIIINIYMDRYKCVCMEIIMMKKCDILKWINGAGLLDTALAF